MTLISVANTAPRNSREGKIQISHRFIHTGIVLGNQMYEKGVSLNGAQL